MKILCAYYNEDSDPLEPDPTAELEGHETVVVHDYNSLKRLVLDSLTDASPFAVVLSDVALPRRPGLWGDMMPTALLQTYVERTLIRGLGIFVPTHFESEMSFGRESYYAIVADRTCWTSTGKRDWRKLLSLVVRQVEMIKP